MNPTPRDVHIDAFLTDISIAFLQAQDAFVADRVFPIVEVAKQSDRYFVFDRAYFNRDVLQRRAPGTESAGTTYRIDNSPTYFCDVWAIHQDLPDQMLANADLANLAQSTVATLTQKALIRRERSFAQQYLKAGVWDYQRTGVASNPGSGQVLHWSNDNSDPIKDIRAASSAILESTAYAPNTLVLGQQVYDALMLHPDIIDRIKYSAPVGAPAVANTSLLAQLFDVERVLVSRAIVNTAPEGATAAHQFIAGKSALLLYVAPQPALLTPSAGYTMVWAQEPGQLQVVRQFRMEHLRATRIEVETAFDQHLVSSALGAFFETIVA